MELQSHLPFFEGIYLVSRHRPGIEALLIHNSALSFWELHSEFVTRAANTQYAAVPRGLALADLVACLVEFNVATHIAAMTLGVHYGVTLIEPTIKLNFEPGAMVPLEWKDVVDAFHEASARLGIAYRLLHAQE